METILDVCVGSSGGGGGGGNVFVTDWPQMFRNVSLKLYH